MVHGFGGPAASARAGLAEKHAAAAASAASAARNDDFRSLTGLPSWSRVRTFGERYTDRGGRPLGASDRRAVPGVRWRAMRLRAPRSQFLPGGYGQPVGRTSAVMRAALVIAAVGACVGRRGAIASAESNAAAEWRAAPGTRVTLELLVDAGEAGWCVETATTVVTPTSERRSSGCQPPPRTSSGAIYAETCSFSREEGPVVSVLTRSEVAWVSIEGGPRIPTAGNPTLPEGLRAASLQRSSPEPGPFVKHCPAVAAYGAGGDMISMRSGRVPSVRGHGLHPQRGPLHHRSAPARCHASRQRPAAAAGDAAPRRAHGYLRGALCTGHDRRAAHRAGVARGNRRNARRSDHTGGTARTPARDDGSASGHPIGTRRRAPVATRRHGHGPLSP